MTYIVFMLAFSIKEFFLSENLDEEEMNNKELS